jgi:hypothetical protein
LLNTGWRGGAGPPKFQGAPMDVVYGSTFGWDGRPSPLMLVLRLVWGTGFLSGMIDGALIVHRKSFFLVYLAALSTKRIQLARFLFLKV